MLHCAWLGIQNWLMYLSGIELNVDLKLNWCWKAHFRRLISFSSQSLIIFGSLCKWHLYVDSYHLQSIKSKVLIALTGYPLLLIINISTPCICNTCYKDPPTLSRILGRAGGTNELLTTLHQHCYNLDFLSTEFPQNENRFTLSPYQHLQTQCSTESQMITSVTEIKHSHNLPCKENISTLGFWQSNSGFEYFPTLEWNSVAHPSFCLALLVSIMPEVIADLLCFLIGDMWCFWAIL